MKMRTLGINGPQVSGMGLGCMRMSFADKPADKNEMINVLHQAVDMGITFLIQPKCTAHLPMNCY